MPINTTMLPPSAYGLTSGINRNNLPFGLNSMLAPAYASMQAVGTGVSQALGFLPSLFGGNNRSAATAGANTSGSQAANNASGSQAAWKGCGCGAAGCGNKGSQSQGTQSQDTAQRSQDSVSKQDSSGSRALPPAPPPSMFNN